MYVDSGSGSRGSSSLIQVASDRIADGIVRARRVWIAIGDACGQRDDLNCEVDKILRQRLTGLNQSDAHRGCREQGARLAKR